MVPRPCSPMRARARSATSRTSFTPAVTADSGSNAFSVAPATRRAIVVLPVPGGPQRITDESRSASMSTRRGLPGPRRCCWPTTSSSERGRSRAASGARPCSRSATAAENKSSGKAHIVRPPDQSRLPRGRNFSTRSRVRCQREPLSGAYSPCGRGTRRGRQGGRGGKNNGCGGARVIDRTECGHDRFRLRRALRRARSTARLDGRSPGGGVMSMLTDTDLTDHDPPGAGRTRGCRGAGPGRAGPPATAGWPSGPGSWRRRPRHRPRHRHPRRGLRRHHRGGFGRGGGR